MEARMQTSLIWAGLSPQSRIMLTAAMAVPPVARTGSRTKISSTSGVLGSLCGSASPRHPLLWRKGVVEPRDALLVVFDRLERHLFPEQAEVVDRGVGEKVEERIRHADTGAQDGGQADPRGEASANVWCKRGLHLEGRARTVR